MALCSSTDSSASGDRRDAGPALATEIGKKWYDALKGGDNDRVFATAMEIVASLSTKEAPIKSKKAVRKAWQAYTALADKYNEPGRW